MATENWYPIAGATHDLPAGKDAWTNSGGANKNASTLPGGGRIGPATHDDDTTYIVNAAAGNQQALNIDWPNPMLGLSGAMHQSFRHRLAAVGPSRRYAAFSNAAGTISATPPCDVNDNSSSYADTTSADISGGGTARPGGGAWVLADFADDKTIFVVANNVGGTATRVTSLWGDIGFIPPAGGFVFLLGLAGLAAIPFVGRLTDFAHFRSYLAWRRRSHPRHTILTGAEVEQAWDEIRAYRHPHFFLPAVA